MARHQVRRRKSAGEVILMDKFFEKLGTLTAYFITLAVILLFFMLVTKGLWFTFQLLF